ncbi:MAG: hypothetical protein ACYDCO_12930 [Armatimonadota bacterium]
MTDDSLHESADLQWELLTSDDHPARDWTYCRARVPGGWLVRCERWYDLSEPGFSLSMTFVPDPGHEWAVTHRPVTQHAGRPQEPPPPPPAQTFAGGLPPQMRVRYKAGAESKVRYVPQNVKKVIQCVNGARTVEEIARDADLDPQQTTKILQELINHNILELFE